MKRSNSVERLNVFLSNDDLREAANEIINQVRPQWKGCELRFKVFTDGITNRLIGCYVKDCQDEMLLIRVYGEKTELFIDRELEIRNMCAMHLAGLAPPLYCIFQNGICYGYTPGAPLDEGMMRDPHIFTLVGETLARMHTVKPKVRKHSTSPSSSSSSAGSVVGSNGVNVSNGMTNNGCRNGNSNHHNPHQHHNHHQYHNRHLHNQNISNGIGFISNSSIDPQPSLFRTLRRFLQLMPTTLADKQQNQRFKSIIPPKDVLETEVSLLEAQLTLLDSPIVFCHNDLLTKNIIYNEQDKCVTFIDFEYADYNYQAFDIGNHFVEFCGVEPFDPSRYPSRETQLQWLTNYLEAWHSITHYDTLSHDLSPELCNLIRDQVEVLYVHVNKFSLASHLFWGIWALIQAANSRIQFDFLGYGAQRINEYFARRDEFFALKSPIFQS